MSSSPSDYPLPNKENERVRKLHDYNILDTPAEPAFDNLTSLATDVFEMPISLVCLVDEDRQWFKSHTGLNFRETERECAFCNYVLLSKNITVIEDAREDPRVKDNRLVIEDPEIRSYAGAPLETDDGHVLGSFCVLGLEPREFTEVELKILERFAFEALSQIELRYKNDDRRRFNLELQDELKSQRRQLDEKEIEIQELLHRTKNYFSTVKSLLNLRRNEADDNDSSRALARAEIHLSSFVSIHEQLSETRRRNRLKSGPFLQGIIQNVQSVFEEDGDDPRIETDIENVELSGEQATNFGIVLNELLSNAYEHVFFPGKGQHLSVEFRQDGEQYRLVVTDDGPGVSIPDDSEDELNGLRLVNDLVEHQENGSFTYEDNDHTSFTVIM